MDVKELRRLKPALDRFAREFNSCIKTVPSRRHLLRYMNGQLGALERKSVEPIALDAGVPVRTLQEFLSHHRWDEEAVSRHLREILMCDHADPNAIGVIDETSFVKKGDKTAGVQRQYCGHSGKVENCVVTVHLGYVTPDFHALIDGDLYVPEESWVQDPSRCHEAKIPDDVVFRPKGQIALDLLRRSLDDGVRLRWITADEFYGHSTGVEPIALDAGVPVRTLQEFLSHHRWDEEAVSRHLREILMCDHADPNAIGVIDETSFVKKGDKTAGVQRQYCGHSGKVENCVVTVHLGYVTPDFHREPRICSLTTN